MIRTQLVRPSLCGCEFSIAWDDAVPAEERTFRTLARKRACARHEALDRDGSWKEAEREAGLVNAVHAAALELEADASLLGAARIDSEGRLNIEARGLPRATVAALKTRLPEVRFR